MIIAIYGIPRCGKDTFIKKVCSLNKRFYHLQGSKTLNELSKVKFDCSFKELDSKQQNEIRVDFTKYAKTLEKDYSCIIVDGHYSFPLNGAYKSVFTESDLSLYDSFFYLKVAGEEILRNFNSGDKKSFSEILTKEEKCEEWIEFEIQNMKSIVEEKDKDFIVINFDEESIQFVSNYKKTSKEIAKEIALEIKHIADGKQIIITDLDKTVSINDLTNDFIESSLLDSSYPKKVFKGDYYSIYQFYKFHNFLLSSINYKKSIKYALDRLIINEELIKDLFALKKENNIFAITTGMVDAWNDKNREMKLFSKIYGFDKDEERIISPLVKKLVVKNLIKDFYVLAIGDSIIDLGMILEASKGYLISMLKLDKRIVLYHDRKALKKEIYQPSYSTYKYDFVKEEELKW